MKRINKNYQVTVRILIFILASTIIFGESASVIGGNVVNRPVGGGYYWNNTNTHLRVQFVLSEAGLYQIFSDCSGSPNDFMIGQNLLEQPAGAKIVDIDQEEIRNITGRADDQTFTVYIKRARPNLDTIDTLFISTVFEFKEAYPQGTHPPNLVNDYDTEPEPIIFP